MNHPFHSILAGLAMALCAAPALAYDTFTFQVSGQSTAACEFTSPTVSVAVGNIAAGTVGKASAVLETLCTMGTPYTIAPVVARVSTSNNPDQVAVTSYKDAAMVQPLAPGQGMAGVGNGSTTAHTVHFRLNGAPGGVDHGEGPLLLYPQAFSVSYAFTLVF